MNRRNFLKGSSAVISAIAIGGIAGSSFNKLAAKTKSKSHNFSLEFITDKPEDAIRLAQNFFDKNSFDRDVIKFSEYPVQGEIFGDIVFVKNGRLINYKTDQSNLSSEINIIASSLGLPKKINNPSRLKFYHINDNARAEKFLIFHKSILIKSMNAGSVNSNTVIEGTKGKITLNIENKKARVIQSSCIHKTCINTGSISIQGESIVCIPNEIFILCE